MMTNGQAFEVGQHTLHGGNIMFGQGSRKTIAFLTSNPKAKRSGLKRKLCFTTSSSFVRALSLSIFLTTAIVAGQPAQILADDESGQDPDVTAAIEEMRELRAAHIAEVQASGEAFSVLNSGDRAQVLAPSTSYADEVAERAARLEELSGQ
jgi:hypothetical protein